MYNVQTKIVPDQITTKRNLLIRDLLFAFFSLVLIATRLDKPVYKISSYKSSIERVSEIVFE